MKFCRQSWPGTISEKCTWASLLALIQVTASQGQPAQRLYQTDCNTHTQMVGLITVWWNEHAYFIVSTGGTTADLAAWKG